MQLIKLTSNKISFKTVEFKKNSINIITWTKSDSNNINNTFNWVWKSLLLNIINFCLWSSKYSAFEEKLKWWDFSLEFEIWDISYIATRKTENQNEIILNWETIWVSKYREILWFNAFNIPDNINWLSFRSLIKRFLRVEKESCRDWNIFKSEKEYSRLLNTAFLLWLDVSLVQNKQELKSKYQEIDESRKRLEKDDIFRKFFLKVDDIDIQIWEYSDKVKSLEKDIKEFKIAENYRDIEKEADILLEKKNKLIRSIFFIEKQIKSINESLEIKVTLSLEKVYKVYEDLNIKFPELLKKNIDQVEEFHNKLIESRHTRFISSKYELINELKNKQEQINKLMQELDSKTEFLWAHWALEEYDLLNKKLSDEKNILSKLKSFQDVLLEYKKSMSKTKLEIDKWNNLAIDYLSDISDLRMKNNDMFKTLAKRFYPNSTSGISVKENDWMNQIQFDIDVKIEYDTSDWIWEIKIFCFDLCILLLKHNHNIDFIFHDSRILSDVDPRQIATLFLIIKEFISERNFQYIITINQNTLESIKDINKELYNNLKQNEILELTDKSCESKLLWINIDLDYEK